MMIRPSNSGTATWVATSSGVSPSSEFAQTRGDQVRHSPCRIGMSSAASAATSQASSSPPAVAVAGLVPPAASTVTISASKVPSWASRSSGAPRRRRAEDRHRDGRLPASTWRRPGRARMRCCRTTGAPGSTGCRSSGRLRRRRCGPVEQPPGRQPGRRIEALAGQQHGVAAEGVQLPEVGRAALGEVLVRLRGHADRHRGQPHQFGVRRLLAAQHDHRHARRPHRIQAVLPGPRGAQNPDDHQVGAVQHSGQLGRDVEPGRVRQRVVGVRTIGPTAGRCPTWTAGRRGAWLSSRRAWAGDLRYGHSRRPGVGRVKRSGSSVRMTCVPQPLNSTHAPSVLDAGARRTEARWQPSAGP